MARSTTTFRNGHTAWNKGMTKETDERVRRGGEKQKGKKCPDTTQRLKVNNPMKKLRFNKGTFRKGHISCNKGKLARIPELTIPLCRCGCGKRVRKMSSSFIRGHHGRGKASWSKGLTKETDTRVARIAEANKGNIPWSKGLTKEIDGRLRGIAEKLSKLYKGCKRSENHRARISEGVKKAYDTMPEIKIKQGLASRKNWQNPDYREKTIRNILKGVLKRPTSYEQKIIDLSNKYNLPFRYVGNGQVLINFKNPDFIECNGRKLLIEVYASFWHNKNYEKERTKVFAEYGFKTLFLSENDLDREEWGEHCLLKIRNFCGVQPPRTCGGVRVELWSHNR